MRERMNDGEDLLKKQRIRNKAKRSAMSEKAVEFMGCDIVDHRPWFGSQLETFFHLPSLPSLDQGLHGDHPTLERERNGPRRAEIAKPGGESVGLWCVDC